MSIETIAELRRRRYNSTVVSLRKPNSDLMIVRVRPDFAIPPHRAGQYTTLGLGTWEPRFPGCQDEIPRPGDESRVIRRAYSISCSVIDEQNQLLDIPSLDWMEFYIVLVRETADPTRAPGLTPRIFMLREGDRLQLGERITGHFTLEGVQPDDTVLFLSTGTGEAPHNYMLWELLSKSHRGRIVSVCCVRYLRDLGYTAIHEHLMQRWPQYTYVALTTREAANVGNKVYVQDMLMSGRMEEIVGQKLNPATTHVYLCGNPAMIGLPVRDAEAAKWHYPKPLGVIEILETQFGFRRDVPADKFRGNIHSEEYW
jgi:ferredoxin--NADP+ reductase